MCGGQGMRSVFDRAQVKSVPFLSLEEFIIYKKEQLIIEYLVKR